MNTISEMNVEQILLHLEKEHNILIPFYMTRGQITSLMGTELTDEQWSDECESIQEIFGSHLEMNLCDELEELYRVDLED